MSLIVNVSKSKAIQFKMRWNEELFYACVYVTCTIILYSAQCQYSFNQRLLNYINSFLLTSRMQQKPSRVSPASRFQWRSPHPPTRSQKSPFPQPTSPRPAERKPERKPPNPRNLPNLPNPQRCPKPRSLRRCRRSRKEGRRKQRRRKSHRRLLNPPALQRWSLTQKTSWVKWTSRRRPR